ncbi:hypothetical protein HDE_04355 [Halotydeus destructor]|nr:hypothetical protein HDE_04355 [Halotydeus destructor]
METKLVSLVSLILTTLPLTTPVSHARVPYMFKPGDFISLGDDNMYSLNHSVDMHIPFAVDDKLFKGAKFKCLLKKRNDRDWKHNIHKVGNYTDGQRLCAAQHAAEMRRADYGGYSYCIADTYNRLSNAGRPLSLTADNKTMFTGFFPLTRLNYDIIDVRYSPECKAFCRQQVSKYEQLLPGLNLIKKVNIDGVLDNHVRRSQASKAEKSCSRRSSIGLSDGKKRNALYRPYLRGCL